MSIIRIELEKLLLERCYDVAVDRHNIKTQRSNQQVSSRAGHELHWDGLRAEAAVAQYLGVPESVDYSVKFTGDTGSDLVITGLGFQIKASTYDPPFLRFNITGSQTFKSDAAIVTLVPKNGNWVDLWGWVSFEEFHENAKKQNFGYGDRLVMKPPFNDMSILKLGIKERLSVYV